MRFSRSALALAGALALVALAPAAPASPLACADPCIVAGSGAYGFLPPVVEIVSGQGVTWGTGDTERHVNQEGAALLGQDPCFSTFYDYAVPGTATFTFAGGVLSAVDDDGVARACTTARVLPNGDAQIFYQCVIHPVLMRGALLVTPAP